MSQLPDDTLRKILHQIRQTSIQASRALSITRAQASGKERERRITQLTLDEISRLDKSVKVYKGVGKMFMMEPKPAMEKELKAQEKELADEASALGKKVKYLEKQYLESQAQLRSIFPNAHAERG